MSNTNESVTMTRLFADAEKFGYALAMGKDTFTDVGDRLFRGALSDPSIDADTVAPLYSKIREHAVATGIAKGKPMPDQSAKSKASQVSKLANFPIIALFAQENDAVVPVYEWMRGTGEGELALSGYTKVLKALGGMRKTLASNPQADEADLRDAVEAALVAKDTLASDEVQKIADSWNAMVHGTDKTAAPFPDMFAALLGGTSNPHVKEVGVILQGIVNRFREIEAVKASETSRATSGLSL